MMKSEQEYQDTSCTSSMQCNYIEHSVSLTCWNYTTVIVFRHIIIRKLSQCCLSDVVLNHNDIASFASTSNTEQKKTIYSDNIWQATNDRLHKVYSCINLPHWWWSIYIIMCVKKKQVPFLCYSQSQSIIVIITIATTHMK